MNNLRHNIISRKMNNLTIVILFFCTSVFAHRQSDSLNSPKKHEHIIDIEYAYGGGLGYNYFYNLNNRFSFGAIAGISYAKSGQDIIPENARIGVVYKATAFVDYRIWKSLKAEIGGGYFNTITWPQKTNINPNVRKVIQDRCYLAQVVRSQSGIIWKFD
jgi:hypothetical protein